MGTIIVPAVASIKGANKAFGTVMGRLSVLRRYCCDKHMTVWDVCDESYKTLNHPL